jgi:hypothetical protein
MALRHHEHKWEPEASRCSIVGQHAQGGARDRDSLTSVRAYGQPENARSYASCACIGRLGGAELGGTSRIMKQSWRPAPFLLFIISVSVFGRLQLYRYLPKHRVLNRGKA